MTPPPATTRTPLHNVTIMCSACARRIDVNENHQVCTRCQSHFHLGHDCFEHGSAYMRPVAALTQEFATTRTRATPSRTRPATTNTRSTPRNIPVHTATRSSLTAAQPSGSIWADIWLAIKNYFDAAVLPEGSRPKKIKSFLEVIVYVFIFIYGLIFLFTETNFGKGIITSIFGSASAPIVYQSDPITEPPKEVPQNHDQPVTVYPTVAPPTKTYSCPRAPTQQLIVGGRAYVCTGSDSVMMRAGPDQSYEITRRVPTGSIVSVLDGPRCGDGFSWWYTQAESGATGWMAEGGDAEDPYFLCPYP